METLEIGNEFKKFSRIGILLYMHFCKVNEIFFKNSF